MIRSVAGKVAWVGRTASVVFGPGEAEERERISMRPVTRMLTATAMLVAILLIGGEQRFAHAGVTEVEGSAYGYFSSVSLFGGPASPRGPSPTVTLPPGGSNSPITATAPAGSATYGPATIFSSGQLTVNTQGTTGSTGSVTSSTNIQSVNTSGSEVFTAASASSTCDASESGVTGSTTITNGTLQTSEGNPQVEGDETIVPLPTNPAPNTTYNGQIESVGDSLRYVFNEQIVDPSDGSITVNAAHQYLLGPTAVGELIIGGSGCGVTADTTRPTVLDNGSSLEPDRGATGALRTTNVSATFSEAMKPSTLNTTSFKLQQYNKKARTWKTIPAALTLSNINKTATLDPFGATEGATENPLAVNKKFRGFITTGAKDLAGNPLASKFIWTFKTGGN